MPCPSSYLDNETVIVLFYFITVHQNMMYTAIGEREKKHYTSSQVILKNENHKLGM